MSEVRVSNIKPREEDWKGGATENEATGAGVSLWSDRNPVLNSNTAQSCAAVDALARAGYTHIHPRQSHLC